MSTAPMAPTAWPFSTVDEMLQKAERELARLRDAEAAADRTSAIDHAINACVAVWHVADWAHDHNLSTRHTAWEPFCKDLTERLPSLRACRDIADFYKHSRIKRQRVLEGEGVSIAYAVDLLPGAFALRGSDLTLAVNDEPRPFTPLVTIGDDDAPPAQMVTVDVEAETTRGGATVSVKMRMRSNTKRAISEVVQEALDDWRRIIDRREL